MSPTYSVYWAQKRDLAAIESYVKTALDGVPQDRIVAISHAMMSAGGSEELYSVLITIRDA
jgi:hypothetical protein